MTSTYTFVSEIDEHGKFCDRRVANRLAQTLNAHAGKMVRVTVTEWSRKHSDQQRGYVFAVLLPICAEVDQEDFTDQFRYKLMFKFMPECREAVEVVLPETGELQEFWIPKSLGKYTVKEMTTFIDRVLRHYDQALIDSGSYLHIPRPREYVEDWDRLLLKTGKQPPQHVEYSNP